MGQYWYVGRRGRLVYGENLVELPQPETTPDTPREGADRFGPTVDIYYKTDAPYEADRRLTIGRVEPEPPETLLWPAGLASGELGLVRNAKTGGADLHIRLQASLVDYLSIATFASDLENIFQNNIVDGVEVGRQDFSFTSRKYGPNDRNVTITSNYGFFSEEYETTIASISESSIPNAYAVVAYADYNFESVRDPERVVFDEDISNHVNLFGRIDTSDGLFGNRPIAIPGVGVGLPIFIWDLRPYIDYVREWAGQYRNLTFEETTKLEASGKNIIRTYSNLGNTTGHMIDNTLPADLLEEKKVRMPFYIEINAPVDTPEGVSDDRAEDVDFSVLGRLESEDNYGPHTKLADMVGDLTTVWTSHLASVMDPAVSLAPGTAAETATEVYGLQGFDYFVGRGTDVVGSVDPVVVESLEGTRILDYNLNHLREIDPDYDVEHGTGLTNSIASLTYNAINNGLHFDDGLAVDPAETFDLTRKLILDGPNTEKGYALSLGEAMDVSTSGILEAEIDLQRKLVDQFVTTHFNYKTQTSVSGEQSTSMESTLTWRHEDYTPSRSYKEAFEYEDRASDCFTQTICYGIDKYRGDKETGEYVQTIWLPNNGNDLNYIDSQVRYGQKYTYDAYAYKYVFGMDYKYEQVSAPQETSLVPHVMPAETVGYVVRWNGAKNLFDKIDGQWVWALVAARRNVVGNACFSGFFGPTALNYNYFFFEDLYGDKEWMADCVSYSDIVHTPRAESLSSYGEMNEHSFTIAELNDLFYHAWNTRPTSNEGKEYDSWDDIWTTDTWGEDDLEITEDTPIGAHDETEMFGKATDLTTGSGIDLKEDNPRDYTITQWFKLFFGAVDGQGDFSLDIERKADAFGVRDATIYPTQQGYPPSHHLLYDHLNSYEDGTDRRWTGFEVDRYWRGYSDIDIGVDEADDEKIVGVRNFEAGEVLIEDSDGFEAEYKIVMKPATRIVKVPYFTRSSIVLSNPPPPPEVSIVPYRAVNNNLLFSFDATFTKQEAIPIAIEPEEEELIAGYYDMQSVRPGRKILFESDDIPASFQVYRLDHPPNSYSDFAGNLRATISTLIPDPEKIVRAASATYVEKLQPNIKYYYTYRTVDFHGNVSNPTVVYEIEVVDDGGAVYPLIKTYEFPIIDTKVSSIAMKKLIEVIPSLNQVTANVTQNIVDGDGGTIQTPSSGDLPEVRLGSEDLVDPIWDKTFKIRLTSKKTGKKIDFNVTFKTEDEREVED